MVLGWASAASAEPPARLDLSWTAPPGCPTAENVHNRVDALLGGGAAGSSVADVRAAAQVERVDTGFRLLLTMGVGSAQSSRVIEARSCERSCSQAETLHLRHSQTAAMCRKAQSRFHRSWTARR